MMNIWLAFQNGSRVIGSHWVILLVTLVSLIVAAWFTTTWMRRLYGNQLDHASQLTLGLGGSILTLILLAAPAIFLGVLLQLSIPYRLVFGCLLLLLFLITLFWNLRNRPVKRISSATWILLAFLLLLVILRMSLIVDLQLPLYTDGMEHYVIAMDLLNPDRTPQAFYAVQRLLERYYHLGYHFLVVYISSLSNASVNETMLVLGQVIQAIIPTSLFFPVKAATKSDSAGMFAVLLAGLGWTMPAFASNWSKYPSITSLAGFPLVLSLLYLTFSSTRPKGKWIGAILVILSACLAILAHTRMAIAISIGIISFVTAFGMGKLSRRWQVTAAAVLAVTVLATGFFSPVGPDTSPALAPYLRDGMNVSLLILFLLPFAVIFQPAPTALALTFSLLLLACLWIPLPESFTQYGYFSLLDIPFVQISLFLPFAMIGGLGLAGLRSFFLARGWRIREPVAGVVSYILAGLVLANAIAFYPFSPAPSCNMVSDDDLAAMQWIKTHVPKNESIFVPGHRTPFQYLDVDAAMWITPLTGRDTVKREYTTDFSSPETLEEMCLRGVTHVYASSMPLSFRMEALETIPVWYQPVPGLGKAQIYQVIGCR